MPITMPREAHRNNCGRAIGRDARADRSGAAPIGGRRTAMATAAATAEVDLRPRLQGLSALLELIVWTCCVRTRTLAAQIGARQLTSRQELEFSLNRRLARLISLGAGMFAGWYPDESGLPFERY